MKSTDNEIVEKNLAELKISLEATDMANAVIADAEEAYKILGRIEAADFMLTVSSKMIAESAIQIKNRKLFKNVTITDENGIRRHVSSFEEFCQFKLKKSRQRVEELIRNYNLLGPELYEQAERLGFGQRDYNALKALPADDRLIIAQAIEAEDLDKALDLMQQLAAKHQREKEDTHKKITQLTDSLDDKDLIIKHKTEQLNKKTDELILIEKKSRNEVDEVAMPGHFRAGRLHDYALEITQQISATLNSEIHQLFREFNDLPPKHIELAAAQAIGLVITAAYGVAENWRFSPVIDTETAAEEPGKALYQQFMSSMGEDGDDFLAVAPIDLDNSARPVYSQDEWLEEANETDEGV